MPDYRRVFIKGGTYFLTLVTYKRQRIFADSLARTIFFEAVKHVQKYHPFEIKAYCILPDHIHLLMALSDQEVDYPIRVNLIKGRFSKLFIKQFGVTIPRNTSQIKNRELTIWQRRYWEHHIRDEEDFEHFFDYIHYNPIKHGEVEDLIDWKDSSFLDYVAKGYYEKSWGKNKFDDKDTMQFGE